jgi:hypothetical protein
MSTQTEDNEAGESFAWNLSEMCLQRGQPFRIETRRLSEVVDKAQDKLNKYQTMVANDESLTMSTKIGDFTKKFKDNLGEKKGITSVDIR